MNRRSLLAIATALLGLGMARATRAQNEQKRFSPQELDQILAPIALYPDSLLSQTLIAASYPLEIVEAARWSKANPNLKGEAAVTAVKEQSWDVSVKSLVAFPAVLMPLNDHLDWTQKLGDAMISQQQDVADSIQRLRARAEAAGNLKSGPQQTVTSQGSGDDRTVVIEPANPDVIYVPSYNPCWAYGAWPVTYGETGVSTFMVSQSGDVYEKDLGPDTPPAAAAITLFNPDKTWDKADMTPPPPSP
jgi:hypothetical protein